MRTAFFCLAPALGLATFLSPAEAQNRDIRVCVVESGALREVAANYDPVSGDTVIGQQRFSRVHPSNGSSYTATAAWYRNGEALSYDGESYVVYGLPRILGVSEVLPVGEYRGVTIFAESGSAHDTPEVVYIPVRPGCEFQPYQVALDPIGSGHVGRINVGEAISGMLESTDATATDDSHYDEYLPAVQEGERLTIDLSSPDFDVYLVLGQGSGDDFDQIDSNDDGPNAGTDSQLEHTFETGGEYTIRANSLGAGETGSYMLSVSASVQSTSEPSETPILSGQSLRGFLTEDDGSLADGSYFDHFIYRASAGERVMVTLESDDFDAFLVVGRGSGASLEEIDSNDDGPDGTNSQLEITVPSGGEYVIRANSPGGGETGEYTLTSLRER